MIEELPCLCCGKKLEHINHDKGRLEENHPDDAVVCTTRGNYGSTVFDHASGHYLEFNICDECLQKAAERGRVALGFLGHQVGVPLVFWTPGLEDEYPSPEAKDRARFLHAGQ